MIDNLLGGNDEDEPDEGATDDMDGGLFDGDEGGDDLMGGGDDLMGGDDDLMGGGDEMGFDDMDDGGSATSAEMDNRLDEIENEVASLSSTVNTVKSENEQISESLGDVEENVRKLLEVYEMVTRGVNPFVDENEMGDAFGGGGGGGSAGGSMGLFGDSEEKEESEAIDESVANADANEFFDEDLDDSSDDFDDFDDFDDEEADGDESLDDDFPGDDFDDGGEFDEGIDDDGDGFDSGFDDAGDFDDTDDNGGGKSFEELKAEYDSGEADWDDDAADAADAGDSDPEPESEVDAKPMDVPEDGIDDSDGPAEEFAVDDPTAADSASENTSPPASEADSGSQSGAQSGNTVHSSIDGGKPYLETLPAGYLADIVVMDWLEFLVEEAGTDGAARTIAYYEAIEWVGEDAAETLQTFLDGFGERTEDEPEPRSSLTVSHHNTSLRFISRISNPDMEMVAFDERTESLPSDRSATARRDPAAASRMRSGSVRLGGMESDGGHDMAFDASCFQWVDERVN